MKTIIIHGHTNIGLRISKDSKNRCLKAIKLFKQTRNVRIICTGGLFNPQQRGINTSHALSTWLFYRNIPREKIIEEDQSVTTIENVEKTIKLLGPEETVYVVTSNYHYLRTKLIWKLVGRRKVIIFSAKAKISLKKILTEIIGVTVVFCWYLGYKFPEFYIRKKLRIIK